ncbi:MAG: prepilin-type N-terminal cleavage/methylation domain-containing protein [Candidatus Omnitrophota bacterium]
MIENVQNKKNGFTPLEKDNNFNRGLKTYLADASLKVSPEHAVRVRRTLTGFTPLRDNKKKHNVLGAYFITGVNNNFCSNKKHGYKSLTGFTLIEILIALTILGIGLVSVLAYLPIALDASKKAADLTTAALIAQKYIEGIKSASSNDITSADAYDTLGVYAADSDFDGFSYFISISNPGASDTKEVTVNVRWSFKGKDSVETFRTMIVKYDPN